MHINRQYSSAAVMPAIDRGPASRRRWLRAPIALALAAAALAGAGASSLATASASIQDCSLGNFCAWKDTNFGTLIYSQAGDDINWHDENAGDDASSIFNNGRTHAVRAYRDVNYGAPEICFARGTSIDNLRGHSWIDLPRVGTWSDDISSHRWTASC